MKTDAAEPLFAGVGRVDITGSAAEQRDDPLYSGIDAGCSSDRLYVRALVLQQGDCAVVLITVDAVAIGEIGSIGNDFLPNVRAQLASDPGLAMDHIVINASHCHGVVCDDVEARTVQAVRLASAQVEPVVCGAGRGFEDRIMENRRMRLRSGAEADVRRAYSLPPDEEVTGAGPVDPDIGVLCLQRTDASLLAVVYNFACHPIQGVPDGGNTADLSGFASQVIEEELPGAMAFFVQGCAADINPVLYRDTDNPPDASVLGHRLGLSTLRAVRQIQCAAGAPLALISERIDLPRADLSTAIARLTATQARLLESLRPTSLNLKSFVPLLIKHRLAPDYPSYDAHRYLHEASMGREDLRRLDENNRQLLRQYEANVQVMEQLTRLQENLRLLHLHHDRNRAVQFAPVEVEVTGLRVGAFVLLTFPGELPAQIGLQLKARSPHKETFVAGVTNGYLYYTPTVEQLRNQGGAQEDSDCLVAPAWQELFERTALDILRRL